MQKKLYIIEYEGAHWCGGVSHCLVYAEDETEAEDLASDFMDENMRELFSSEYDDDRAEGGDMDNEGPAHSVHWVQELTPEHDYWQWVQDPDQQAAFYPYINQP